MPIDLGQQCCDANDYLSFGCACALQVDWCWDELRPIGAGLYFSLPFRLGLLPGATIFFNVLLLLAAAWSGVSVTSTLLAKKGALSRTLPWILQVAVYTWLVGRSVTNSLSDAPSAALVTISMWLLVMAGLKGRSWLYAASGALLGAGAIVRAFYLYPALLSLGALFVLLLSRRLTRRHFACFAIACLVPIALQYTVTHSRTGAWTFIDPAWVQAGETEHFRNAWYGYDTVAGGPQFYSAAECFSGSDVMRDAIEKRDVRALGCLLKRRQWFYLGSFVPDGATYLSTETDRRFSYVYLFANSLALACGALWALQRSRRQVMLVPLFFTGCIWAEASLILPESRFMLAFHALLWTLASAAAYDLVTSRFPLRFRVSGAPARSLASTIPSLLAGVKTWFQRVDRRIFLALAVGAAAIVQAPVLGSDFTVEDLRFFYEGHSLGAYAHLTGPCMGHYCGSFRLVAALMNGLFGQHAVAYFFVVLVTHLANVALLFRVIATFGVPLRVAAALAGSWGAAPLFQENLVRFSEYGHVIGVTATLWAAFEMARAAETRLPWSRWALVRMNLALVVGATADRASAIAAIVFPLLAHLILPSDSARRRSVVSLLPAAALALTVVLLEAVTGGAGIFGRDSSSEALARYGYAAGAGIVFAAALSLRKFLPTSGGIRTWSPRRTRVAIMLVAAWCAACALLARKASQSERTRREQTRDWAEIALNSVRLYLGRVPSSDPLYFRNDPFRPAEPMHASGVPRAEFPGIAAYWILALGTRPVDGRPIRFVEEDQELLDTIRRTSRASVAALFVSPDDVARAHGTVRTMEISTWYLEADPFTADHRIAGVLREGLRLLAARRTLPWGQAPPSPSVWMEWDPVKVMKFPIRQTPEVLNQLRATLGGKR